MGRSNETSLPEKKESYSILTKIIWEDIGIKNPGKDQDLLVLKPYIDLKIEQRTKAKYDFDEYFFKLINNLDSRKDCTKCKEKLKLIHTK